MLIEGRVRGTLPRDVPFVIFAGGARVTVQHEGRSVDVDPKADAGTVVDVDVTAKLAPPPPEPVAPPPAPPPPARPDDGRPTSSALPTTLMITGGSLIVVSAVTWIYAATRVSKFDSDVAAYCGRAGWRYEGTYCVEAAPGTSVAEQEAAQRASDSAASWRAVRTGGIVGLVVGGAVAVTGVVLKLGDKSESKSPVQASASASPYGATFSLSGVF